MNTTTRTHKGAIEVRITSSTDTINAYITPLDNGTNIVTFINTCLDKSVVTQINNKDDIKALIELLTNAL